MKAAVESGVRISQLPTGISGAEVESFIVTLPPGAVAPSDGLLARHQGAEFCLVYEGVLTLSLGFEKYDIGPGDSVAFESSVPHLYANEGDVAVRVLWQQTGARGDDER